MDLGRFHFRERRFNSGAKERLHRRAPRGLGVVQHGIEQQQSEMALARFGELRG
ncbi:MAG: hypothetical protein V9H26_13685 [Verrucomicrobiota bacterium]